MSERPTSPELDTPSDWVDRLLADDAHEYAAQVWRGVAELLAKGLHALHPTARIGLVIGGTLGIVLTLLERAFPKHKQFIPSPTGLGLALTLPGAALDVAREAFKLFAAKPFSLSEVFVVIAIAGAGMWVTAIVAWRRV